MATIIRHRREDEELTGRPVQPVLFNLEDMGGRAQDYLQNVRGEAAKIVQQAHQEAEQVRRKAKEAGRATAEAAMQQILDEKVAGRMKTITPALELFLSQMEDARGDWLRHWEATAVEVATAIAERIIRRELDKQPEIVLETLRESLELAAGADEIKVHISPTDHENLGPQIEKLAAMVSKLAPADIVADEEVSPGGCRVMTKYGEIDQQIETQLERIAQQLTDTN